MDKRAKIIIAVLVIVAIAALDVIVVVGQAPYYIHLSAILTLLSAIAGFFTGRDKNNKHT